MQRVFLTGLFTFIERVNSRGLQTDRWLSICMRNIRSLPVFVFFARPFEDCFRWRTYGKPLVLKWCLTKFRNGKVIKENVFCFFYNYFPLIVRLYYCGWETASSRHWTLKRAVMRVRIIRLPSPQQIVLAPAKLSPKTIKSTLAIHGQCCFRWCT